ncbi:bifunctional glutamate N-acetyltransferase/amino-acid acetyltransferase ArgJ [Desulfurispirillum indicum]|uniref:Arginine biosynthesis bifunctional protein ArgJ n=1 Tax=Desulfurispirillum indicum (strain ATCC BAA-1389 / DSM 22839 / S5) TaxID=653733 RepID=E6W406_DESIS|nr:bifunctional glutamate N-acetyltransferase/amino-acid acetyltransferase ArgJ [Desulfurispirillum indicum]ADU65874.1 arginine biosynthesis bifunctional protein ArgJ [Desulfurispirillum indicum S5]UCZ57810.1 bifunctional glutamate N-acetyltransferase/amino-acid acetyltransferase ArgJ [Desulfurispirillum indicum]
MSVNEAVIWDQHAVPRGFLGTAGRVPVKPKNTSRDDMAIIYSPTPCTGAAVFTTNRVYAAPIDICRQSLQDSRVRAIIVNSGNANASTGAQGEKDARAMADTVARSLQIGTDEVLVASTGVIGVPLPMDRIAPAITAIAGNLSPYRPQPLAMAIKTTDLFEKFDGVRLPRGDREIVISAICKGAGMICPNMATMLCFVQTDANLTPAAAQKALRHAVDLTFNRILVDGDMSTNDMVSLLANGESHTPAMEVDTPEWEFFRDVLTELLLKLAKQIVRDGEGSTKTVHIVVRGAASDEDARTAARSIADSNLCKTAFFGSDPNWGRIAAAVGYSGAAINRYGYDLFFDREQMVADGIGLGDEAEKRCAEVLAQPEFTVTFDLKLGSGTHDYWCSDLGYEYVRVNADYRT